MSYFKNWLTTSVIEQKEILDKKFKLNRNTA